MQKIVLSATLLSWAGVEFGKLSYRWSGRDVPAWLKRSGLALSAVMTVAMLFSLLAQVDEVKRLALPTTGWFQVGTATGLFLMGVVTLATTESRLRDAVAYFLAFVSLLASFAMMRKAVIDHDLLPECSHSLAFLQLFGLLAAWGVLASLPVGLVWLMENEAATRRSPAQTQSAPPAKPVEKATKESKGSVWGALGAIVLIFYGLAATWILTVAFFRTMVLPILMIVHSGMVPMPKVFPLADERGELVCSLDGKARFIPVAPPNKPMR